MKSSFTKAIAIAVIASGLASQAYAEHPTNNDGKRAEANQAYWKAHPQNGGSGIQTNNGYPSGQSAIAKSNMEYFAAKENTGSAADIAKNADYEFATSPSQRLAKSNYDYFKK